MESDKPNRAYYRALEGRWKSPFQLQITDLAALRASPQSVLDRLSLLAPALLARAPGSFLFETSVRCDQIDKGRILHTTRLSRWGITFSRSEEVITLDDNGRDFTMRMVLWQWPMLSRARDNGESHGDVDESGTTAHYDFPLLGTRMKQTGHREGEVTRITQETPFARGVQLLRRVR